MKNKSQNKANDKPDVDTTKLLDFQKKGLEDGMKVRREVVAIVGSPNYDEFELRRSITIKYLRCLISTAIPEENISLI